MCRSVDVLRPQRLSHGSLEKGRPSRVVRLRFCFRPLGGARHKTCVIWLGPFTPWSHRCKPQGFFGCCLNWPELFRIWVPRLACGNRFQVRAHFFQCVCVCVGRACTCTCRGRYCAMLHYFMRKQMHPSKSTKGGGGRLKKKIVYEACEL